jgi:glutamate N-acetyltransferase/amino-acid N-acetyltransferase
VTSGTATGGFFRSRWVDRPSGVEERSPDELPAGFRAAGVACGIKSSGALDLGLLVCDSDEAVSAARFTRNALVAAPVTVSRRSDPSRFRAVVVNSGNANVSDGRRGLAVAQSMSEAAGAGLSLEPDRVGVASTGVIGVGLPRENVLRGVDAALAALGPDAGEFAQAIMTTDRTRKYATLELNVSGGTVRLSAQAKGAGMISPSFATMLCFAETDVLIDTAALDRLLGRAVARSFERASVDGQLSTNDSVFMIASGASGVQIKPGSDDERIFTQALDCLFEQLAIEMVADGEGATRVARLEVAGAAGATEPVARAVANSPLVRCALYGGDPNFGRMLQAAGQALADGPDFELDLAIEEIEVARANNAVDLDDASQGRLRQAMQEPEVQIRLRIGPGDEASDIYFSDLGHEYIRINSEYAS